MKLTRLNLRRVDGVELPFAADFEGGLNLLVGPNSSGKSSLLRAARGILWPDTLPGMNIEIEANWDEDGTNWYARRSGRRITWQRNGAESAAPVLPGAQVAPCYDLRLEELLCGGSTTENEIATEVCRQMAGGFDVEGLRRRRFSTEERHGHAERVALEERRRRLTALRNDFRKLAREEEEELRDLKRKLAKATASQDLQGDLQIAIQLAETRSELEAAQAALRGFPDGMDQLKGNESELLQSFDHELASLRASLDEWTGRIKTAKKRQEECPLPDGAIGKAEYQTADLLIRRLREEEATYRSRKDDAAEAQAAVQHAWRELGGSEEVENLEFDLPAVAKLDAYLARAEVIRHTRSALKGSLEALPPGVYQADLEDLRLAADALREWLTSSGTKSWFVRSPMVAVCGAIGAVGGILFGPKLMEPLNQFAPALGALGLAFIPVGMNALAKDHRYHCQKRFEKTSQKPPKTWNRKGVQEYLVSLDNKIASAELTRKQQEQREFLNQQLDDLKKEEENHAREREELRKTIGMDPGDTALGLVDIARRMTAWRGAKTSLEEALARVESAQQDIAETLKEMNGIFAATGFEAAEDAHQAADRLEAIRDHSLAYLDAEEQEKRGLQEQENLKTRIKNIEDRVTEMFAACGLRARDREDFLRRIARWGEFRKWRETEDHLRSQVRSLSVRLKAHPELKEMNQEDLRKKLKKAQKEAAQIADLSSKIGMIDERLGQVRNARRMEQALAETRECSDRLVEKRKQAIFAACGQFLLEEAAREYNQQSLPAMVRRAKDWVNRFTRHTYELRFIEGKQPGFCAVESTSRKDVPFSELSQGTRAQVLLAVRMAFSTQSETGHHLPVFLDDILASADAERFRTVAESVLKMVEEGRQVVYSTASDSDVAFWKAICKDVGMKAPNVVDVGEIRGLARLTPDPAILQVPEAREVPDWEGMSAEEYAKRIKAGPPVPFAPVEEMHLIHLLPDHLPVLAELIGHGVETVGQWRAAAAQEGEVCGLPEPECSRISALCDLAEKFVGAWREGRGRPVDRVALEASGLVGDEHLDTLMQITASIRGDAGRLLHSLESQKDQGIGGLFEKQLGELRAWFQDQGYLDTRQPLDKASIRSRLTRELANHFRAGCLDPKELGARVNSLWAALNGLQSAEAAAS